MTSFMDNKMQTVNRNSSDMLLHSNQKTTNNTQIIKSVDDFISELYRQLQDGYSTQLMQATVTNWLNSIDSMTSLVSGGKLVRKSM